MTKKTALKSTFALLSLFSTLAHASEINRSPANFWGSVKSFFTQPTLQITSAPVALPSPSVAQFARAQSVISTPVSQSPVSKAATATTAAATAIADPDEESSVPPQYKSRAILFGGSCDQGWNENQFHESFIRLSKALVSSGWEVKPLYEGDIARCSIPSTDDACQGSNPSQDCCPAGINMSKWSVDGVAAAAGISTDQVGRGSKKDLIAELERASQDLGSGDELLLVIDTHGWGAPKAGTPNWHHSVCVSPDEPHTKMTSNYDQADGTSFPFTDVWGLMPIDDPSFLRELAKLKAAGIKLAFTDDSCYGGGSIPVLGNYGCTLSSTSATVENVARSFVQKSGGTTIGPSYTNVDENLAQLLALDKKQFALLSLSNPSQLTMDEVILRVLSRARLSADEPESSALSNERSTDDQLATWINAIDEDSYFGNPASPFQPNGTETPDTLQSYVSNSITPTTAFDSLVSSYWPAPGFGDRFGTTKALPQATFIQSVSDLGSSWANLKSKYLSLVASESAPLSDATNVGVTLQFDFSGIPGGQQAFDQLMNGQGKNDSVTFNKITADGTPWLGFTNNIPAPGDTAFQPTVSNIGDTIANQIDKKKSQSDAAFRAKIIAVISSAETNSWSALDDNSRTRLKNDFQQIEKIKTAEMQVLNQLPIVLRAYATQARMYSYLKQRQNPQNDAGCADFILKQF